MGREQVGEAPLALVGSTRRRTDEEQVRGTAHLFFVRPAASAADEREGRFADLFATHPPVAARIARLRGMAYEGPDASLRA